MSGWRVRIPKARAASAGSGGNSMSLINQMLQDLDARRAAHGIGANLPNDVRPLPAARSSRRPLVLGVVVVVLLAGWGFLHQREAGRALDAPILATVPLIVAHKEGTVQAARALQATVPPSVSAAPPQDLGGSLRMADAINLPSEQKPAAKPASAPLASEKPLPMGKKTSLTRDKSAANGQMLPASAEASQQTANKAGKPPTIERTDTVGTPRERVEAEYRKAIVSVNQGRVAEALEALRAVLKQESYHVASRQLLAKLLLEAKRTDEAMLVLQDGLQGQPAQIGWATSLARLQVDRGDLAGAWQTLNYSSPVAGNNADYQGFSAHVLQRLGRNKEAAAHYQAAARVSPGDGRWWLGLGLTLEAEGQSSEAREAFLRARQCNNLNAELVALVEQRLR